jgi:hypothetical protein
MEGRRRIMKMPRVYARQSMLGALALAALLVPALGGVYRGSVSGTEGEDFYIISSVDTTKKQIVLKRPTEVTELLLVTEKTAYISEEGKPLRFEDLRAGDTIYLLSRRDPQGNRVAIRIRKGPMTMDELRRRYLQFR